MKRLLLVDDDKTFTQITKKAFDSAGIQVDSVPGLKGLTQCDLNSYDCFLIDYDLADATGDQALEFLTKHNIQRPTAMISASNRIEQRPNGENRNLPFITKWQQPNAFLHQVIRML